MELGDEVDTKEEKGVVSERGQIFDKASAFNDQENKKFDSDKGEKDAVEDTAGGSFQDLPFTGHGELKTKAEGFAGVEISLEARMESLAHAVEGIRQSVSSLRTYTDSQVNDMKALVVNEINENASRNNRRLLGELRQMFATFMQQSSSSGQRPSGDMFAGLAAPELDERLAEYAPSQNRAGRNGGDDVGSTQLEMPREQNGKTTAGRKGSDETTGEVIPGESADGNTTRNGENDRSDYKSKPKESQVPRDY